MDPVKNANQVFADYIGTIKEKFHPARKMVLIQCPTFGFESFKLKTAQARGYFAYPPKGLQSLLLVAEKCGVDATILDANFQLLRRLSTIKEGEPFDLCQLLRDIIDEHLDAHPEASIVGVGPGVNIPNIFKTKNHPYLETIKYLAEKKKYLVLTGGAIATVERRNLLNLELVQFVFRGEAECKFKYFLESLFNGGSVQETPGIFFQHKGSVYETTGIPDIVNPDIDFIPSYKQIPIEQYCEVGCVSPFSRMLGNHKKYATVQLVRGCRGRCTFCELRDFRGDKINTADAQTNLAEVDYLVRQRGIRHIEWLDDDFLARRSVAARVLNGIVDAGYPDFTWAENVGIITGSLDREILKLMVKSGCVGFRIGIETGNREVLKKSKKPASMRKFLEVADLLKEFPSLFVVGLYMMGFENETYRQIYHTIGLAKRMNVSWSSISVLQVTTETNLEKTPGIMGEWKDDHQYDLEKTTAEKLSNPLDYSPSFSRALHEEEAVKAGVMFGGRDLMNLPLDQVHSRDLLPEIWFAFNMIMNFVDNKNLKNGGNPSHFIQWVKGLQESYPDHASMSLFLFLGHTIMGKEAMARVQFDRTLGLLEKSSYWRKRFEQYDLRRIVENPPRSESEVQKVLASIKEGYHMNNCVVDNAEMVS